MVDPLMWRTSFDVNRMFDVSYSSWWVELHIINHGITQNNEFHYY